MFQYNSSLKTDLRSLDRGLLDLDFESLSNDRKISEFIPAHISIDQRVSNGYGTDPGSIRIWDLRAQ